MTRFACTQSDEHPWGIWIESPAIIGFARRRLATNLIGFRIVPSLGQHGQWIVREPLAQALQLREPRMHRSIGRRIINGAALALLAGGLLVGCVQQKLTITSEPSGALVFLNGSEVGRTPLTRDFIKYGNYDVQLRKDGYETLDKPTMVLAPWWQWFPIDFVAELMPFRPTDHQSFHYTLTARPAETDTKTLIEHAEALRQQLPPKPATAPSPAVPTTTPAETQPLAEPVDVTPVATEPAATEPATTEPIVIEPATPTAPATEPVELNK